MARTYIQVQREIEKLNAEAEKLRQAEIAEVVAKIREAIGAYGLTMDHLGFVKQRRTRGQAVAKKPDKSTPRVKCRDGNGNTWSGRGPRPAWLREALAAGRTLEEFAA